MPAPPIIRQLPDAVANQIAAGEVVERPSAVVKELAENSLDAGARRVVVRCEDGGRRLVEVEDDGHGMHPADLRLALSRHATSKLATADDLFRVATLGFRGEALPSIAAVSEFTLASRPHDADMGSRLSLTGGREDASEPCAMSPGTRVSVRNLFWNVPARLKFLKSEASETGHVTDQVIRLALSHPAAAFRLECDGRAAIDLPAAQTLDTRVRALFGRTFADSLIAIAADVDGMQLAGYVVHPREAKPTAKRQYCFLNGRFVRDKLLLAAVREGFKGFLEPRLHGAVFLHLDVDPAQVDVNVHPTKSEVRFRREGEVFVLVSRAVRRALEANSGNFSLLTPADAAVHAATPLARRDAVPAASAPAPSPPAIIQERYLPHAPMTHAAPMPAGSPTENGARRTERVDEPRRAYDASMPSGVRRVLQLNRMYLLIETDTGIRLVDQHALHEKALFLCLDPAVTDVSAGGRQELLVPRAIELGAAEVAAVEPLLASLQPHGIEAEVFGPTTILVR
ncbi:MAG: DNA mismatch repair endonuclease MutL, partial [Planctomycetes bacterium]|nr:DNA mismatch repair endonuclease MutL [Planctomycetota bacterium]